MSKRKLTLANNPLLSGPALSERGRIGSPYREIDIDLIDRDPNQPRVNFDDEKLSELAESVRRYGVLSPILVRPSKTPGRFTLISGERRLRSSKLVGLTSIPAIVDQDPNESGERTLSIQLVENLQRADLTPLERAHAIGALKEAYSLSVREVAERLGTSKSLVQRSLEILELPDDLLNALREGAAESKILLLAKIEDETIRSSYLKDLETLTRGQIKKNIEEHQEDTRAEPSIGTLSPEDVRVTDEIQKALGLKVRMLRAAPNSEKGRLIIDFYSESDLQEIFRKLVG